MPEWTDHVRWIQKELERIDVAEPRLLDRFTRPLQQWVSKALDWLEATNNLIKRRKDEHTPLQDKICDILLAPSEGVEAVVWQLISALADLEDGVGNSSHDVAREEKMVTATYDYLLRVHGANDAGAGIKFLCYRTLTQDEVDRIKSRL